MIHQGAVKGSGHKATCNGATACMASLAAATLTLARSHDVQTLRQGPPDTRARVAVVSVPLATA